MKIMVIKFFRRKGQDFTQRRRRKDSNWQDFRDGEIKGKYVLDEKGLIVKFEGDEAEYITDKFRYDVNRSASYFSIYSFQNPAYPSLYVLMVSRSDSGPQHQNSDYTYSCLLCNSQDKSINVQDTFWFNGWNSGSIVGRLGNQIYVVCERSHYYDLEQNKFRKFEDGSNLNFRDIRDHGRLDFRIEGSNEIYFPPKLPLDDSFISSFLQELSQIESSHGIEEQNSMNEYFSNRMKSNWHAGDLRSFFRDVEKELKKLEDKDYANQVKDLVNRFFEHTHYSINKL